MTGIITFRVVTAHLPKELAEKLAGLAGQFDRPRGWLVKEAVEAYVGLAEDRRRETLAALAGVDSGRVVEDADTGPQPEFEAATAFLGIVWRR